MTPLTQEEFSIGEYWLVAAIVLSKRSTCPRRKVGAILTSDDNKILSSGYNGVPKNIAHCNTEEACPGAEDKSGNTSNCIAVHAEINAIISCTNLRIATNLYTTTFPCFNCVKAISNTNIKRIYFIEDYPDVRGKQLLRARGINVLGFNKSDLLDLAQNLVKKL